MKDWIKKALTKRIRQREIPPDPRLVYGVKFTITMTIILSALEIAHMAILGKWNSEIFAAITGLSGTVMGISVGQKT
jgi:acetylglutamate kinase